MSWHVLNGINQGTYHTVDTIYYMVYTMHSLIYTQYILSVFTMEYMNYTEALTASLFPAQLCAALFLSQPQVCLEIQSNAHYASVQLVSMPQ
jgi:hypothetical protein